MNEFRQSFRDVAAHYVEQYPETLSITLGDERDSLTIGKRGANGFDVQLECMDYGVYPSADGWHTGCWDVTVIEATELKSAMREFVDSMLEDAELEVHFSNGKPHKWIMHYQFDGDRIMDETGLLFFNWFGSKTVQTLRNSQ